MQAEAGEEEEEEEDDAGEEAEGAATRSAGMMEAVSSRRCRRVASRHSGLEGRRGNHTDRACDSAAGRDLVHLEEVTDRDDFDSLASCILAMWALLWSLLSHAERCPSRKSMHTNFIGALLGTAAPQTAKHRHIGA